MSDKFIPLSVPNIKGNELKYITEAVEAEWVSTAGPFVSEFEKNIAEYVGVSNAVACQSGTAGLHISLILSGVTSQDMVIVPTLTFIAAVNPTSYIGATPMFMDCDDSLCIDPIKLDEFCKNECELIDGNLFHRNSGKRIPAMVVVHVFGNMAEMDAIMNIADKYNLKVIEDATEALGTKYVSGKYAGKYAGTIGNIGVYSFNGNKILTTGGGGMIVSNDNSLLERAKHLTTQAKSDESNFIHDAVGYNYRLTNLQAAMGIGQLEQLEEFINIKNRNYLLYKNSLENIKDLTILNFRESIRSNKWFYSLYVGDDFKLSSKELIEYLKNHKIQTRPIWGLIHEQIPYKNSMTYKIEKSSDYWKHVVNLPCSTNLSVEDVEYVINTIKNI